MFPTLENKKCFSKELKWPVGKFLPKWLFENEFLYMPF